MAGKGSMLAKLLRRMSTRAQLVTPNTSRIVARIVAVDDEILRELERRTRPRMKGPRPAISFKRVSGS